MAQAPARFSFISGSDEYLVGRAGRERFDRMVAEAGADEFSREVISGFAANVDEVGACIQRFRESVQTLPMFGGRRVVWLKDLSFLADSVVGRAEGTLSLVADLQELLAAVNPEELGVLVTASPVDGRRSFPKWCRQHADFTEYGGAGEEAEAALAAVLQAEAQALGARLEGGAAELLMALVGPNTRLLVEEIRKLSLYAGEGKPVTEEMVAELTPNVAEGDFFEPAEAFFSGDPRRTLRAFDRHFFAGESARPLLAALQNRNRLLIQVRALMDGGEIRVGFRGIEGLQKAAGVHGAHYAEALQLKSSFNLFSQNPWYLGKLASGGKLPSLRRLIDNQREFLRAFEEMIEHPGDDERVMRDLAMRCLGDTGAAA